MLGGVFIFFIFSGKGRPPPSWLPIHHTNPPVKTAELTNTLPEGVVREYEGGVRVREEAGTEVREGQGCHQPTDVHHTVPVTIISIFISVSEPVGL